MALQGEVAYGQIVSTQEIECKIGLLLWRPRALLSLPEVKLKSFFPGPANRIIG